MHETAKNLKRRGFLLLEGVLLLAVLSALSVGTTAIFSGQFNTMNAGKQASQAQQYASVEGTYVRVKGYPNVDDLTHDWKDMSDLVGTEDGANWESKVEVARTAKTDDGNEMKVIKLSVRKKGDIVSRFSEEIPLVSGLEVYTKDEIDSMFDTVDSEINNLNSDLDAFKNETASNFTNIINNINSINDNLETLRQMIEAEKATREAAINAEHNAWMAALQNEQAARTARDAELTSQIKSLQNSLDKLQAAINTEVNQRKAADTALQNNINSEASARKAADSTLQKNIDTLQNDVNSKYSELKNLYNNLKGRLDGSEFVKSKDAANNIALKYEQKDGESTKSLHGYVDGVEVPLASQDKGTDYQLKYRYYVYHYTTSAGKGHGNCFDIKRVTYFNSNKHGEVILADDVIKHDFSYVEILGHKIQALYDGGLKIDGITKVKSSWSDYKIIFAEGDYSS